MFCLSRITKYPKKRKKNFKRSSKKSRIERFAEKLEKNLCASEKWFRAKWVGLFEQDELNIFNDSYNRVLGNRIPDLINHGYKYIIEIDGSIHDLPSVKYKDALKDFYYRQRGYKVFRVKAYDEASFEAALQAVTEIRKVKPELTSKGKIRRY